MLLGNIKRNSPTQSWKPKAQNLYKFIKQNSPNIKKLQLAQLNSLIAWSNSKKSFNKLCSKLRAKFTT